ncbi:outer dynein arm-docking complex subunit 4-like [Plodia interpunctella]|uniref:outer dynein arm-docking complex subunit 4-like n=1 Tax=Plodia interpunctella TaxID=58824 RepID=UPI00236804BA|nr:outer dynein arm-docking complex subunit 4-like [Plodia interpunctella]
MKKKLEIPETAVYNVVTLYRERGNYLQRLELFDKAIHAYDEALRWNNEDVRCLLGRSVARVKMTHYAGALLDAADANELDPENLSAQQIRAQTNYEKCAFEKALVLASRGQRIRRCPPHFANCARHAEETIRDCVGKSARKVLSSSLGLLEKAQLTKDSIDADAPQVVTRQSRMQTNQRQEVQEISIAEKHKFDQISRLMASKYLGLMAHDKYFLTSLCKDERLMSANKQGSKKLQELANKALADIEKRQAVLRTRRPLYAALAAGEAARARLSNARKDQLQRTQKQHMQDAKRLIRVAEASLGDRDTGKCIENAEFALEQISRKPANLLPNKDKYLHELYSIVGNAFLDQKRVKHTMSESDREKRAFMLLGMYLSREPSRDSILRTRPEPPRDAKRRLQVLERGLNMSVRPSERCYILHELARLHIDTKQPQRARFYALKCQSEARTTNLRVWFLNATFLLARCHLLQNNRPEARATLIEGASLSRMYGYQDVADFYDTCVDVSLEGDVASTEAELEKREKEMVGLMQDDDLKSAAKHLFRKMSVLPANRRFSIMPGTRAEESSSAAAGRRQSIIPRAQQPTRIAYKSRHPLGFQDFDI